MNFGVLVVGFLFVLDGCNAADKTVTVDDRHVKATDGGGAVVMFKGTNETNCITVMIDSVKEVQSDGSMIGTIGTATRSITDLSQNTFTFSAESTMKFPGSQIDVTKFSMSTELVIDSTNDIKATLTVELLVFKAEGMVSVDGANVTVRKGDVKYDVKVENWPFCGANNVICDNGNANLTGAYLDIGLDVMGQEDATLKAGTTMVYKLGDRPSIRISNKVMTDGSSTAVQMPANYPMLSKTADKQLFTSRVEKFTTSAVFGFILSCGRDDVFFDFVEVTVQGKSGKMKLSDTRPEFQNNTVVIEFDNLEEVTDDDSTITGQNSNKHRFNTFANQDFDISQLGMTMYHNLEAKHIQFSATLTNGAKLTINIYLFLDAGTLANGNEIYNIKPGTMKFNVDISDWGFCGDTGVTCSQGTVGAYLYFDIVVKGKADKATKKSGTAANSGDTYALGGADFTVAKVFTNDGVQTQMPTGYPAYIQKGSKDIFRFKYTKFSQSIVYDPNALLEDEGNDGAGDNGENGDEGDGSNAGNYIKATFSVLLMALINVFWQIYQ